MWCLAVPAAYFKLVSNDDMQTFAEEAKEPISWLSDVFWLWPTTPVRFHSSRLKDQCVWWQPCEIEGLSVATAINAEYNLLCESKHPILILADSEPIADAIKKIQEGKFSSLSCMNHLLFINLTSSP